jgi:hypothetical protein
VKSSGATGDRTRKGEYERHASTGDRVVANRDTPSTSADSALNEASWDRCWDHDDHVQQATVDVEAALAKALEGATAAGRFDVVAQLAKELEARRLARMGNVVALPAKTRQRGE